MLPFSTRALLLLQGATLAAGLVVALGSTAPAPAAAPAPVRAVTAADPLPPPGLRSAAVPAAPAVPRVLPRAAARPAPVHHRRHRPVVRTVRPRPRVAAPALTPEQRLDRVVARIPGYTGGVTWVVTAAYGSWGTADWYQDRVYVSPLVPANRLYDVAVHEWSHLLSVRAYGGDVDAAMAAMDRWYGGSGLVGAERAADCMARRLGAVWTHYTACTDAHWQDGARLLVAGKRLY